MGYLQTVCESRTAYIQKVFKELTGSFNGATESLTFERPARSSTAFSATRKPKRKNVTAWDSLLQKTAARVPVHCVEIEQLTTIWCVKAQYVASIAANDACRVCDKALKTCLFCSPRYLAML